MRGYGLPRNDDVGNPDIADIVLYGLKAGRLCPKWTANGDNKKRCRRIWKKKERQKYKKFIKNEILNLIKKEKF